MGAIFHLEHTNFISYLISKETKAAESRRPAPRTDVRTLRSFLELFSYENGYDRNTISNDKDWQETLGIAARSALSQLPMDDTQIMRSSAVANALNPLAPFFTGYKLYVLIVPPYDTIEVAEAKEARSSAFEEFAAAPGTLVLMPSEGGAFVNVIDPFPGLRELAWSPVAPPATVFWTRNGTSLALNLPAGLQFFRETLAPILPNDSVDKIDNELAARAELRTILRILHISDVHFGHAQADERRLYLEQHLASVIKSVDHVVLSGDLFHSPSAKLKASFMAFRHTLENWTKRPIILVPGNHDVRWWGNAIGRWLRNRSYVYDLGFTPLIIHHETRLVFFSFDSCEVGDWARGGVSQAQRLRIAVEFDQAKRKNSDVEKYERIAIVHHHPYEYDAQPTALYERLLDKIFGNSVNFLTFENADQFVNWCGMRKVSLILHGHKHIPHCVLASVDIRNQSRDLIVVGCGSSTGVDEKPMCYNIVAFDPESKQWAVSFFHDPDGDGSGFDVQNVALDLRTALP
ncbi:metallophosphoesterase [Bradyrhizobium sp. CCBAU 51765]|uniref:metallophosphoesterase family protein n=1 Tax=Bradyrhizobium sp. CCBAU 51765 TaxID=1325102 RepID=UPI001887AEE4|nr:metallophosphoesterase [Bradyrhizobium sp. CCBAU 51765]